MSTKDDGIELEPLMVGLSGMGTLALELRNIHRPVGIRFLPSGGWSTSFDWAPPFRAYVAAGRYGAEVFTIGGPALAGQL